MSSIVAQTIIVDLFLKHHHHYYSLLYCDADFSLWTSYFERNMCDVWIIYYYGLFLRKYNNYFSQTISGGWVRRFGQPKYIRLAGIQTSDPTMVKQELLLCYLAAMEKVSRRKCDKLCTCQVFFNPKRLTRLR